jgi:hypothetical protein
MASKLNLDRLEELYALGHCDEEVAIKLGQLPISFDAELQNNPDTRAARDRGRARAPKNDLLED